MNLRNTIRSVLLRILTSPITIRASRWWSETRRQLGGRRHRVSVFMQIDDPYSYILSNYLPSLAEHYDIELRVILCQARGDEFQPEPQMQVEYAIHDCARVARELGIAFLDKSHLPPTEHRAGLSDAVAASEGSNAHVDTMFQALAVYWRGDAVAAAAIADTVSSPGIAKAVVSASQRKQRKMGHYASAMLHYGGEWYWGIDRLHFLTARLDELGLARHDSPPPELVSIAQARSVTLPVRPPAAAVDLPPLEFFYSFRSPYSYLALRRTFEIADAFGLTVNVRPVLPMVMRGMQVPRPKMLYIARDTKRVARQSGLAFGKLADPVGRGVERCLAVYVYAESERRERDFLMNAGHAIWAAATDLASDKGLRKVTGQSGLFWPDVEKALQSSAWRDRVEANREAMLSLGSWGVPTFRLGEFVAWGQDRDWMLVRHIEELCDSGDGILV